MTDTPEASASGAPETVVASAPAAPSAAPKKRRQSAPKINPTQPSIDDIPAPPLFTIRTF